MNKKIKLITFDLDDTLWDNHPTIIKAERETRKWIEGEVGKIEWGDFNAVSYTHLTLPTTLLG